MHVITQSAILFLWMQTLTFVRSEDCTLKQFFQSNKYDENFDTSNLDASYPPGKQLRVSCNVGYTGFFKLICTERGWETRGAKCEPKACGHPGDAQFADFALVQGDDFVFGSRVVYTCQKGYQMVSRTSSRQCMAGGWDGVVPVCEAQQCPAIHVDGNVLVTGDPDEATFGNVVRFSCKSNTEMLEGPVEIYCDEYGAWSAEAPKCKEITCEIPVIENGFVHDKKLKYNEKDVLHFTCNPSFKPAEVRPSTCAKFGYRAEWSPTPLCEPIKCRLSVALEGTSYDPAYRNVFSPGDTLRVNCGEKYWISEPEHNSAVTTCNPDGEWTIRPVCQEVRCSNQRQRHVYYWNVYRGKIITLDETVGYSCYSGYKSPDGRNLATCTRQGWRPDPLCQEITCEPKRFPDADPEEPFKDQYSNYEKVRYTCKEGFTGQFTLTCRGGSWTGSPGCTAITCDRQTFPDADPEGRLKYRYSYNERVRYICKEGYDGEFTLTCGERGWIRSQICRAITCDPPTLSDADPEEDFKSQYSYNEEVRYICKDRNAGEFTLKCGKQGWIRSQQCAEPFKDQYSYNEEVRYICKKGYDGEFTVTCGGSGWIRSQRCRAITCDPPTLSDADPEEDFKSQYSYNEEVRYICKDRNAGEFTLKCGKQGWIGSQQCAETACTKPSISNGFVVGPINQTVYFACNEGYKLFTKGWWGAAKCDGTGWSVLDRCIAKSECGKTPVIANGEVAEETGQIKCNNGYQQEVGNLTCQDGKWTSGGIPLNAVCRSIGTHCKAPRRVENAVVLSAPMKEYLSDSSVTYQCHDNYTMVEENTILCKNGTWEQKSIHCTEITCDRKDYPYAVIAGPAKDNYKNKEEAVYDCTDGGQFTLTCGKTGWTGSDECRVPTEDSDAGPIGRPW